MSNKKQVEYPVVELKERGKLFLTDDFLMQINYLHSRTGAKEWSGLLMYEVVKGSIAKPKEFSLRAKHIFLMDIGTSAYTEYKTDEDIVDLYDNIEGSMDMKTGQIHTHHNMGTFFSGTDKSELMDNVDKYNYYLSLIVNFEGNYAAKVAFLSDVKTQSMMSYSDDAGQLKTFKTVEKEKAMVVIDMQIYYDSENTFFFNRYDQVVAKLKQAEAAKKLKTTKYTNTLGLNKESEVSIPFEIISDADPMNLTNMQVEHLTRNILSVTTDMSEKRSVYTVLNIIVDKATPSEMDVYYQLLSTNLETVIEEFFDQALTIKEMTAVITEVAGSVSRFGGYVGPVGDLVKGVNDVLMDLLTSYTEESDAEDDTIEIVTGSEDINYNREIAEVESNI
jgi:hypothetical protein